ncbi:hypothetical protein Bbelb_173090 [Branchiostoma belcheri]|nr:hypothetical protein Bbelb_173090 [Branchiostoma belcheri]
MFAGHRARSNVRIDSQNVEITKNRSSLVLPSRFGDVLAINFDEIRRRRGDFTSTLQGRELGSASERDANGTGTVRNAGPSVTGRHSGRDRHISTGQQAFTPGDSL